MIYVVTLILAWVLLFVLIALVQTFLHVYKTQPAPPRQRHVWRHLRHVASL